MSPMMQDLTAMWFTLCGLLVMGVLSLWIIAWFADRVTRFMGWYPLWIVFVCYRKGRLMAAVREQYPHLFVPEGKE